MRITSIKGEVTWQDFRWVSEGQTSKPVVTGTLWSTEGLLACPGYVSFKAAVESIWTKRCRNNRLTLNLYSMQSTITNTRLSLFAWLTQHSIYSRSDGCDPMLCRWGLFSFLLRKEGHAVVEIIISNSTHARAAAVGSLTGKGFG